MTSTTLVPDIEAAGIQMHAFVSSLYPICRSITGEGTRRTLGEIKKKIGIDIHSVPSGTRVLDWDVPDEWNITNAYIADRSGTRIVDFRDHSLHVLNYSEPINRFVPLDELKEHLYSIPEAPDLIPYRTSYYKRDWGFCLRHSVLETLHDTDYEVLVESTLGPGELNYGELLVPGDSDEEVLFSTHVCHPSLANDNLSGVALLTHLAMELAKSKNRYSYRFLFIPGTIGSITWLALNEERTQRIRHGLVVACVGDPGHFQYKRSRQETAEIDQAVEYILRRCGDPFAISDFSPYGYDERQYCSPGFDLPVGSLTRTPHGKYPEYHTSADNLEFVTPMALSGSLVRYLEVVEVLEKNRRYVNTNPRGEPQLGRRGLYRMMGGYAAAADDQLAMLWMLNMSDGKHSMLDIARRSGIPFERLAGVAQILVDEGLLK